MDHVIKELEHLAHELRVRDETLSIIVHESRRQAQEEFERVLHAVDRMHNLIAVVPEQVKQVKQNRYPFQKYGLPR